MTPTMEFDCKLAHADGMRRLSNFKSLKELYEQIGKSFSVPMEEVSVSQQLYDLFDQYFS